MASKTFITVDASKLPGMAALFDKLAPEELGKRMAGAINAVTEQTYDLARENITSMVGLTDNYIRRKMEVKYATAQLPQATIRADGTRKDAHTNLSEYGAMTSSTDVNWSNERIAAMGVKFGKWPGWVRRTGNKGIGVAVGKKATGTSVEVKRGARKRITSKPGFQVGKFKDGSKNAMVFERIGKGKNSKIKAMYGPSVYQLFRTASGNIQEQVSDNLYDAVSEVAGKAMKEIFQ